MLTSIRYQHICILNQCTNSSLQVDASRLCYTHCPNKSLRIPSKTLNLERYCRMLNKWRKSKAIVNEQEFGGNKLNKIVWEEFGRNRLNKIVCTQFFSQNSSARCCCSLRVEASFSSCNSKRSSYSTESIKKKERARNAKQVFIITLELTF